MKRDMDLVRQIMLRIEALPAGQPMQFRMGEVEDPVLIAHLEMMIGGGLVNGKITQPQGTRGAVIIISDLTWCGHEWIETVRADDVWRQTTATAQEQGGALSFELAKAVASRILRLRMGLPPAPA
jgi:hypothetical protein